MSPKLIWKYFLDKLFFIRTQSVFRRYFNIKVILILSVITICCIQLKGYYERDPDFPEVDTLTLLRKSVPCKNKEFKFEIEQNGNFWMLKNFIRAEHGELNCYESVTYATHGDFTYLSNLIPLAERWQAPVSVALETPGTDYKATLNSIFYLRNCIPAKDIIRQYVTFHFFFDYKHFASGFNRNVMNLEKRYKCPIDPPYLNKTSQSLYRKKHKLNYNINVALNLAKKCALTYYVLPSDIELYPNPGLVPQFLDMIAKNMSMIPKGNKVFFLPIFEIEESQKVPENKKELRQLFEERNAQFFQLETCRACNEFPRRFEWLKDTEDKEMTIYKTVRRQNHYYHWEPFFIATQDDTIIYDERLTFEGKLYKLIMPYILCVMNYNFLGLSNGFLIHSPGIKTGIENNLRRRKKEHRFVNTIIMPEIEKFYGHKKVCELYLNTSKT